MSFLIRILNNLFRSKKSIYLDKISTFIVIINALIGVNRIQLLDKWSNVKKLAVTAITVVVTGSSLFDSLKEARFQHYANIGFYFSSGVYGFLTHKRLVNFYLEINNFDRLAGCRPSTRFVLKNSKILYVIMFIVIIASILFISTNLVVAGYIKSYILTFHALHGIEFYYYGHMFTLMSLRLKLINHYIQLVPVGAVVVKDGNFGSGFKYFKKYKETINVNYVMDIYMILLKAKCHLMKAISWPCLAGMLQCLCVNVTTLLNFILHCKEANLSYKDIGFARLLIYISLFVSNGSSVLATCICADGLYDEVSNLRMSLASLLYESTLDKKSRSEARALLSLTKERNLTISLMKLVRMDISLPLKYVGVIVTYLIIMLQFQNIVNLK